MIVLDTNVISELMRATPDPAILSWLDARGDEAFALTAVSVAELRFGVLRLPSGRRRDLLGSALDSVIDEDLGGRILPFDAEAAGAYASLAAERERTGQPLAMADGQIGAICAVRDLPLATRNGRDFLGLGVEVHDPWSRR